MTSTGTARASAVDGLRALAALSVVLFHAWLYSSPHPDHPMRQTALDSGVFEARIGLVLFFVLSGCLLYRPYAHAILARASLPSLRRYLGRRVARIVPAYYLALAGALALVWAAAGAPGARPVSAGQLPLFLGFAQNYSQGTIMRLNPVTWTLCVEAAFYAALPAIAFCLHRLTRRRRWPEWAVLAGLVIGGVAWGHVTLQQHASLIAIKALPAFMPYFALGMIVAATLERRGSRALGRGHSALLVAVGLALVIGNGASHATGAAAVTTGTLGTLTDLPAAAGFALLVAAAIGGTGPGVSWLGARPLAAVGVASYGLYLWHVPLMLVARRLSILPGDFAGAFVLVLPAALGIAAASWLLVERRALAYAARARRRPAPRAAVAEAA